MLRKPTYAARQGLQWKIHEHPVVRTRLDGVRASISDARDDEGLEVYLHRSIAPEKKKKNKNPLLWNKYDLTN